MPTSARIPLSFGRTTFTKMAMDGKDAASDTYSEVEYYNHLHRSPWAPVLLGSVDLIKQFSMTRLSLPRPAESKSPGLRALGVYVLVQTDVSILKEWATSYVPPGTLSSTSSSTHAPSQRKSRWTLPVAQSSLRFIPMVWAGYECFIVHCLPALLEENTQWPRLKSIRLHGFDVLPEVAEKYHTPRPQKLLPMVEARFKPMGVDVRSGLGRRMMYEDNNGMILRGDGFGGSWIDLEEEEEDEEDEEEEEEEEEEFTPLAEADPDGLSVLVY
ncbi:hypothetical protein B0H14DRAFT_3679235 [Mycena olivaceomarginata]|nr:hypothetical protein B0H14DRAFT_3679235 [Mycena olivaceomarginata]